MKLIEDGGQQEKHWKKDKVNDEHLTQNRWMDGGCAEVSQGALMNYTPLHCFKIICSAFGASRAEHVKTPHMNSTATTQQN